MTDQIQNLYWTEIYSYLENALDFIMFKKVKNFTSSYSLLKIIHLLPTFY